MDFLNKLEKRFGRFAIPNLYLVIVVITVVGYVIRYVMPSVYYLLTLSPYMIAVQNQYWRLFTWIFTIPYEISSFLTVLFLPINLFFYTWLGKSLEQYWGKFIYNLYIIGGAIIIDIFVLLGALYYFKISPNAANHIANALVSGTGLSEGADVTRYMYMSIFLAFTVVGGDNVIYLYFVIPLKMKYLAYVDLALLAFNFFVGGFFTKIIILCSVANYFIYAIGYKSKYTPSLGDIKRKRKFEKATQKGKGRRTVEYNDDGTIRFPDGSKIIKPGAGNPEGITIHKCAVCGRTEKDSPNMEFRFCSKCNGNYEYCSEHLYTHQHIH